MTTNCDELNLYEYRDEVYKQRGTGKTFFMFPASEELDLGEIYPFIDEFYYVTSEDQLHAVYCLRQNSKNVSSDSYLWDISHTPNVYQLVLKVVTEKRRYPLKQEHVVIWNNEAFFLPFCPTLQIGRNKLAALFKPPLFTNDKPLTLPLTSDNDWLNSFKIGFFQGGNNPQACLSGNPLFIERLSENDELFPLFHVKDLLEVFCFRLTLYLDLRKRGFELFWNNFYVYRVKDTPRAVQTQVRVYVSEKQPSAEETLISLLEIFPKWFRTNIVILWNSLINDDFILPSSENGKVKFHIPHRKQDAHFLLQVYERVEYLRQLFSYVGEGHDKTLDFRRLDEYENLCSKTLPLFPKWFLPEMTVATDESFPTSHLVLTESTKRIPYSSIQIGRKLQGGNYNKGVYECIIDQRPYCLKLTKKLDPEVNVINIQLENIISCPKSSDLHVVTTLFHYRWGWFENDILTVSELGKCTLDKFLEDKEHWFSHCDMLRMKLSFQVLHGIYTLHRFGFVHRDAHESNFIMFYPNRFDFVDFVPDADDIEEIHVKLNDFGVARHYGQENDAFDDYNEAFQHFMKTNPNPDTIFKQRVEWDRQQVLGVVQRILGSRILIQEKLLLEAFPFWSNPTSFPTIREAYTPVPFTTKFFSFPWKRSRIGSIPLPIPPRPLLQNHHC